jgi:CelD/BcsL family acetyltransferase involved in cellulose biosynthesis
MALATSFEAGACGDQGRESGAASICLVGDAVMADFPNTGHTSVRSTGAHPRTVYQIQPLQDPRWAEFVDRHPRSSVFHTVAWLEALHRTYGYQPIAYTTSPPGISLEDGLVFCRVTSWITGRRLISLPFSDHCEPLVNNASDEQVFVSALEQTLHREKLRYIEIRTTQPLAGAAGLCSPTQSYYLHQVDLRADLAVLFNNSHKSSTQRKILRAEREGLICETGQSQALLDAFWNLLLITRRRHQISPQPKSWFRNLVNCFGDALQIRVAFKDKQPVASILTLRHKDTLVYKYGCSDTRFNNLGGTQLLFWRSIQEGKRDGLRVFDLGRSDCDNAGLITFKDRLGSARSTLTYVRLSASPPSNVFGRSGAGWVGRIVGSVIPCLPDRLLCMISRVLYRHIA